MRWCMKARKSDLTGYPELESDMQLLINEHISLDFSGALSNVLLPRILRLDKPKDLIIGQDPVVQLLLAEYVQCISSENN
jgi:hypothetical protein